MTPLRLQTTNISISFFDFSFISLIWRVFLKLFSVTIFDLSMIIQLFEKLFLLLHNYSFHLRSFFSIFSTFLCFASPRFCRNKIDTITRTDVTEMLRPLKVAPWQLLGARYKCKTDDHTEHVLQEVRQRMKWLPRMPQRWCDSAIHKIQLNFGMPHTETSTRMRRNILLFFTYSLISSLNINGSMPL